MAYRKSGRRKFNRRVYSGGGRGKTRSSSRGGNTVKLVIQHAFGPGTGAADLGVTPAPAPRKARF